MVGDSRGCPHFVPSKCCKTPFFSSHPQCKRCGTGKDNLWLCLNKDCLELHCGKNDFEHLGLHLEESKKRKEFHCVFINIATAEIFCVSCQSMIEDSYGHGEQSQGAPILKIRTKIIPQLKDFSNYTLTGQLENSEAHRKINRDSVGLFSNQFNHSIHSAVQFVAHWAYLKELILQGGFQKESKVLVALQQVIRDMNEARYRAMGAERLDRLIYSMKPELLTYKRKDPLDIILIFLQELHAELKYYVLAEAHRNSEHDEWSLLNLKPQLLKQVCPLYDTIDIRLRLNYSCPKCKLNDFHIKKINFFKLVLQRKRKNPKEIEKEVTQYRGESPLKRRRSSLANLFFKEQELPLSIHELMIDFLRRPLHKEKMCPNCREPFKKNKIQVQSLPDYLLIQVCRMMPQGYGIDETSVSFSTGDVDFGAFTVSREPQLYSFETAIGVEKGFFPVMAKNSHNRQFQIFRNEAISYQSKLNPYIICYRMKPKTKSLELHDELEQQLNVSDRTGKYLLPDFWMLQLRYGFARELNSPFICRHNKLKPGVTSKQIGKVGVDLEIYERLSYQYHGRYYEPEECRQCVHDGQTIELRRREEREAIKRYDSLKTNLTCMIALDWITKWSAFLYKKDKPNYMFKGHPPPGIIDNSSILEGKKCKSHLVPNRDCKIVNYYVWRFLKELYGGGTEIRYKWHNHAKAEIDQQRVEEIRKEGVRLRGMLAEFSVCLSAKNSSTMEHSHIISEEESQISSRVE